jgi:protein TonB
LDQHALIAAVAVEPQQPGVEAVRERDKTWSRLAWQVPLAVLLTLVELVSFLRLLGPSAALAPVPRPLEVHVAEMPPPAVSPVQPVPRSAPRSVPPLPLPERRPFERSLFPEPPRPASAPQVAPLPESAPSPSAAIATPTVESGDDVTASSAPSGTRDPASAASGPVFGVRGGALGGGNAGARVLYQPRPEIPEALRRRSIEITTVARFRVAANGSAQVELTEPSADADLNRAVLDALRRWRFFPAIEDGKPVPSTLDIRIPISVR